MPKFSVVVPAYNVEPYISDCLDSLLGQTFGDLEVVCVDDASTDGTRKVIESYCARDNRVALVANDQNMQAFASRHIGTSKTSGEYVLFVDGDDTLLPETLEELDAQLAAHPVDILHFPMQVLFSGDADESADENAWYLAKLEPAFYEGDDIINVMCYNHPDDLCVTRRVVKGDLARDVFAKLGFERNLFVAEDVVEFMALVLAARTYEIIDSKPYYQYHLGYGFNDVPKAVSKERFEFGAAAKRRCYTALMRYMDKENLHRVGVSEPVAWRWRYSCIQTLYEWQNSVSLDDRLEAIEAFAELWPAPWVLPSVYQFVADDVSKLLDGGLTGDEAAAAKRSLLLNLTCLGSLYAFYNENRMGEDETAQAWADMKAGLEGSSIFEGDSNGLNDSEAYLLRCVRAMSLYHRNELWLADDRAAHAKCELMVAKKDASYWRTTSYELEESRTYKLGTAILAPYRKLRYGVNEE